MEVSLIKMLRLIASGVIRLFVCRHAFLGEPKYASDSFAISIVLRSDSFAGVAPTSDEEVSIMMKFLCMM
uniref:Secreted protein n=1 Tax=Angiostrongylus cantonensis TaxID=6313 RepID=A0A0K0CUS0_ANGCA